MEHRYSHILTPVKIRNKILRNRLVATRVISQELQGPENFPAEATMQFCTDLARNGAAMVAVACGSWPDENGNYPPMSQMHMGNKRVLNYYNKLFDMIHSYGSLVSNGVHIMGPYKISERKESERTKIQGVYAGMEAHPEMLKGQHVITPEEIAQVCEQTAQECAWLKQCGLDAVEVGMWGRGGLLANALSPVLNQREDQYGGSIENRARFAKELFTKIREYCGDDLIITCSISGIEEPPYGYTVEDMIAYAKQWEGLVDIFMLRGWDGASNHISAYNFEPERPYSLQFGEAFKQAGIKALCAVHGGYQNLDNIEQYIKNEQTDLVAMGRAFIADPDYGRKLYSGMGEAVPCIRCDKCHGAVCSVNPLNGISHLMAKTVAPADRVKKVAVIGGGPAGMTAAITAAKRGHQVTLYEKTDRLGGQLVHADYLDFKPALRQYKDYLISQLSEQGVVVKLSTEAAPEQISQECYDAVIAGCGAIPKFPEVDGVRNENVIAPVDVFGNEDALGEQIVVVGGTSTGMETAVHLARLGKTVTLITRKHRAGYDLVGHSERIVRELVENQENLTLIPHATVKQLRLGGVVYAAADGTEHTVPCQTIVFSGGKDPNIQEAFRFAGLSPQFFHVGDCNVENTEFYKTHEMEPGPAQTPAGDIRHATFTGYMAAIRI